MNRISILLLVLPTVLAAQSVRPAIAPVIQFAFYAPAQNDSPVLIVGFEHSKDEIQFVLRNTSDKAVSGIVITAVDIAPPGCAAEPRRFPLTLDSGARLVSRIGPHGKGVASRPDSHYPRELVRTARLLQAASLQAQFGVIFVYFEDGTTWPAGSPKTRVDPFDSALSEAEAGKCGDVAIVTNALESVEEVVFDRESSEASVPDHDKSALPHLFFRCSLEGPKAICRMPMATHHITQGAPGF